MIFYKGIPGGSVVKNLTASAGDLGLIPGLGRPPGEGSDNPLQYSCLENSMERGAWWYTLHRVVKTWTQLRDWAFKRLSPGSSFFVLFYFVFWLLMSHCFSNICCKGCPACIELLLHFYEKNQLDIIVWAYLWVLYSIPLIYTFIPLTIPHHLDYCESENVSHSVMSISLWPHGL